MSKVMKQFKIEGWAIVTAEEAGVLTSDADKRFVVGTYQGMPIRTSYIMHNAAPHYVETVNSVYGLGEPVKVEQPLTAIQNQAVAVVKQGIVDEITKAGGFGPSGKLLLDDSAQATAYIVVRALVKAHLLVK